MEKTNGLIKKILEKNAVPDNTIAILVSAIYFKANWLQEYIPYGKIKFWNTVNL